MEIKLITLIENNKDLNKKLINEHGLSIYIEAYGKKILFDTGKSNGFLKNANSLGVDLSSLDYVVLSHGHYDHGGGFKDLVSNIKNSYNLLLGNSFFDEKYELLENNTYKFLGVPFNEKYLIDSNIDVTYIKDRIFYINENIMIFSNFERRNNFEKLNERFCIKNDRGYYVDEFKDEIVLGINTKKGLILVIGCSHRGIVNIIESIVRKTNMRIFKIIGGTHLVKAKEDRINKTIKFLEKCNINSLYMCHCTGEAATKKLSNVFRNNLFYNNTGNIINIRE
ncbi:MAG: MBL fold metallo-hydrolase [Clostridium perfringens]|nr:MBL fold metallo-hydrolase [Clostridium perfringens]